MKRIFAWLLALLLLPWTALAEGSWDLLREGYIFTFPLVLVHTTRARITAQTPVNRFNHAKNLATARDTNVVTPNVDTVYSQVWLDLAEDAVVLVRPEAARFCSFEVLDAYTNCVAILGTGGDGQHACSYLLTGPAWQGDVPAGMVQVPLPTSMGWIIGRTICSGEGDMENVRALQEEMWVGTLTEHRTGIAAEPPAAQSAGTGTPLQQVLAMGPAAYFQLANDLMARNPPADADAPLIARLAAVGIGPGLDFDPAVLGANAAADWQGMLTALRPELIAASLPYQVQNGLWSSFGAPIAEFGTAYEYRALVALAGLGANPVSVAVYPKAMNASDGSRLTGAGRYVLHFEADALPPVKDMGFWSVTAYDSSNDLLIGNELDRYCINDRSELAWNDDGSLDIYLQAEAPQDVPLSNWLPVCKGEFHLHLRIYLPDESVLNGQWRAPEILSIP